MRLGVRAKLFLVSVGVILFSTFAGYGYVRGELERGLTNRIHSELVVRATMAALMASRTGAPLDDLAAWDTLADEIGNRSAARITFVRKDGVVLGDSNVSVVSLHSVANHAGRPEVRDALRSGTGRSQRMSATVGHRMIYVAVPFSRNGRVTGVARSALPLTELDAAIGRLRGVVLVAFVLALAVAVAMSSVAAELSSRTARALTQAARKMSEGNLDTRTGVVGTDEFAELGSALDNLAYSLSRTLADLRAERDRLGGVLSGMQEGLLLLDGDRRVALVNPALREMLLLGTDVEGRAPIEVIRHAELMDLLNEAVKREMSLSGEIELAGLKPRRLLVHVVPIAGGGLLAVFVDVTHLRKLETMRRDFVANASHELRTPVAAIQSAAETLEGAAKEDPQAAAQFIQIICRNAERLRSLIDDLLDLSRIESQDFQIHPEPIVLKSVTTQVLDLFRDRATRKNIALRSNIDAADLALLADRRGLEHVLNNLVDNAVKYCAGGSTVEIRAKKNGSGVEIEVADDGPGIAAQHLPRLFERFYRVDTGRSRELGGTGLGLSIVKHLVDAMDGTVRVESEPGCGTRFLVRLPAVGEA